MKFHRLGYMYKPGEADWNRLLVTIPRENLEALLYDMSYQDGVLSGLEILQQAPPNLTVRVTPGRAVFRNQATGRAGVMDLAAEQVLDLTAYRPAGSPSTVLIVIEPLLVESEPVTPPNAPVGHPAHDPAYVPTEFKKIETDSAVLRVVGAASGQQVILGSVTLQNAQTQVFGTNIGFTRRQAASPVEKIRELEALITDLGSRAVPIGAVIDWAGSSAQVPPSYVVCDGRTLSRADYQALFALFGVAFGAGDGINTFGIPDLRDRFVVGAGGGYAVGSTGGAETVALAEANLPAHAHPGDVIPDGSHTHGGTTANDGAHGHYLVGSTGGGGSGFYGPQMIQVDSNNEFGGGPGVQTSPQTSPPYQVPAGAVLGYNVPTNDSQHQHALAINAAGSHDHGLFIGNTGGNQAHENRPPYYGLFKILRAR